jgi:hypothetical protein
MNEGALLLLCSENFNIFVWYNYIFVLLSTTTWTEIGDWRHNSMHSLNFGTRWIRVFSRTHLLLYPRRKIFGTNFTHPQGDSTKNLNSIAFGVQTVLSRTLKPFKYINIVGICFLITQMYGKKCTYRIRHVDVTSCEDKSRDNVSMPSRRRQVQGIASILQQVSSSFSLPQLQEVHRDYMWFQASAAK